MSSLDQFKKLVAQLPPIAIYEARPLLGLERDVDRTTKSGARFVGVSITVEILGGPFDLGVSPDNMPRGGDFAGRKLALEFMQEAGFAGVVERDIDNLVNVAEALSVQGKLPEQPTLLDLVRAISLALTPTTKNSTPPRLLLTIRRSTGNGRDFYAVDKAGIVASQTDIFE